MRPSAAHQPDVARRFEVPEHVSIWNQPQRSGSPDGRMNLEELKSAILTGVASTKQDRYISMPLEGRVDLMMPRGLDTGSSGGHDDDQRHQEDERVGGGDVGGDSSASSGHLDMRAREQSGQGSDQSSSEGVAWDAARHPPPRNSRPEMVVPMTTVYAPAWDEPPSASASYFDGMVENAFSYPTLPDNVKTNDWYEGITATKPDPRMVAKVFPWEQEDQSRPSVSRRFPRELSPESGPRTTLSADRVQGTELAVTLGINQKERETSATTKKDEKEALGQTSGAARKSSSERPTLNFAESMASYTNAWDEVASIHTYAQRLTALGIGVERRAQASGLETVVATPRGASSPTSEPAPLHSPSSSSADGDDEEEGDEGLRANIGRRRSPTYRDREAQTERLGVDAMVQTTVPTESVLSTAAECGSARSVLPSTKLGNPANDSRPSHSRQQSSRTWDPNTDIDLRRQDSEEVLHRFMKANTG